MKVAVIGGAGRMGRWLVGYFRNQGHDVVIYDVRRDEARKVAKSTGARLAEDVFEALKDTDMIAVSTPIEDTPNVLKEMAPQLPPSTTLMEISSLKSQLFPVLKEIAERGVRILSVHPLFGPGVQSLVEKRVAVIPVFNRISELKLAKNIFPDAEIVVVDAQEHDRAMALTLSLPHFVNILFASVICNEDIDALKRLGGTTFTLQLLLSEGVLSEDPGLYSSIQMNNVYTQRYLDKFLLAAETLKEQVTQRDEKNFSKLYTDIRRALSKDRDFASAYQRMYKALEAL